MIYEDFESILVPEDNGKQNPEEFLTNKHQNIQKTLSLKSFKSLSL